MSNNFKIVQPGGTPLSSDLNQLVQALSGNFDIGIMSLLPPIPIPSVPTVAVNTTAGVLNGAYVYIQVNVTGWKSSDGNLYIQGFSPSLASATVSPANQQVNVTMTTGPVGTIARALYRPVAGGSASSAKFLTWIGDNTTTAYTDNVADANLGTGMPTSSSSPSVNGTAIPSAVPTVNTTGTFFNLGNLSALPAVAAANTVAVVNNQFYISNGTTWVAMSSPSNPLTWFIR